MLNLDLNLKKYITRELLYYIWVDLKLRQKYFFYYFNVSFVDPLSQYWFYKTSKLLKKGCYGFSGNIFVRKKNFFSRKSFLGLIKFKILENTFLFLFLLIMSENFYLKSFNLTECLRLFLNNKF